MRRDNSTATPLRHTGHDGLPDDAQRIAVVAQRIGLRLMPWQSRAYAAATQRDGDAYRWPVVVISVPRQSGKTTLAKCLILDRLIHGGIDGRQWEGAITAQTRTDAARFIVDWGEHREQIPELVTRQGAGNERLQVAGNSIRPTAPIPEAVHGRTLSAFLWDEAWSVDDERGRAILQAAAPAMITRTDRQIWLISTAGTAESRFFREWVERGNQGEACLVEYGAPEDADIDDVSAWADWHPAFGITQDARGIAQARSWFSDDEPGFRRAYCNQWPEAQAQRGAIPPEAWQALGEDAPPMPDEGDAVFAIDVDPYGLSASVVAAWQAGGITRVELVDHRDGATWLQARVPELLGRYGARSVWAQDYGPVAATLDALERDRVKVDRIRAKDASAAVQAFLTAVSDGSVRHSGQDALTRSALGIGVRAYGDGVQWQRRGTGVTSPITAASWAVWGAQRAKPRLRRPRVHILGQTA